mgnify:CR=1 FL=1
MTHHVQKETELENKLKAAHEAQAQEMIASAGASYDQQLAAYYDAVNACAVTPCTVQPVRPQMPSDLANYGGSYGYEAPEYAEVEDASGVVTFVPM